MFKTAFNKYTKAFSVEILFVKNVLWAQKWIPPPHTTLPTIQASAYNLE